MDDMIAKGRARFRMMAKLSKQNVLDIVKECSAGATVCDVAKKYGVAHPTVSMIMCGQRWSKITGIERKGRLPC